MVNERVSYPHPQPSSQQIYRFEHDQSVTLPVAVPRRVHASPQTSTHSFDVLDSTTPFASQQITLHNDKGTLLYLVQELEKHNAGAECPIAALRPSVLDAFVEHVDLLFVTANGDQCQDGIPGTQRAVACHVWRGDHDTHLKMMLHGSCPQDLGPLSRGTIDYFIWYDAMRRQYAAAHVADVRSWRAAVLDDLVQHNVVATEYEPSFRPGPENKNVYNEQGALEYAFVSLDEIDGVPNIVRGWRAIFDCIAARLAAKQW